MDELLKQYAEMFGDGFPMIPLAWSRSDKEIAKIIEECLKKKKDCYDLGYVKEGDIY